MGVERCPRDESAVLLRYRNRDIRAVDLDSIRSLLTEHGQVGRTAFPRVVCQAWGWRQANGSWSEYACRDLLLRLEERGEIVLPARRTARPRRHRLPVPPIDLIPLIGLEVCDPHADLDQLDDTARFRGTCYRAANWIYLGHTAGRSKKGNAYLRGSAPKALYVYPLHHKARQRLCEG